MTPGGRGPAVRFAPAKLNLTLAVVGRREDGFHALHSVIVPLAFGDEVSVQEAAAGPDALTVDGPGVGAGPDNLVLRALIATRAALEAHRVPARSLPPLAARLTKRIPVAAGLGGGSSDAAATIAACLEAWGATLPAGAALDVAASLGSDVPFFLARSVALVTGRGEFVEPLPPVRGESPAVLIVTPRLPVSTPAVFAAYAARARPAALDALATSERLAAALRTGLTAPELLAMESELVAANDLLPAALSVVPPLTGFREALSDLLGRPAGQSGSGPTAWLLYATPAEARGAADLVRLALRDGRLPETGDGEPFVSATTIATAHPPAAGAAPSPEPLPSRRP